MFYRLTVDIPSDRPISDELINPLKALLMFGTIRPSANKPAIEPAFVLYQQCFHDETPPKPCVTLAHQSLG